MRPQTILRAVAACAAPAALTVAALVAARAPSTDPAPARAAVGGDGPGAVAFRFRPRDPGSAPVRVRSGAAGERVGRRNVYRRAPVSWYGPGLYGAALACGGTLTTRTLGVASTSLPCGANVTLRHGWRTVRVPVVDRGPYSGGREFDLTAATKDRLGFSGVGTVLVAA